MPKTNCNIYSACCIAALLALMLAGCGGQAPAQPAPRQLTGDIRVHDPSMIKQGDSYYVFSTGDERGLNQGTIQIRRSRDLANWELLGTIFPRVPDWVGAALGSTPPNLWAPDVVYFNNTYHVYYAGARFGSNKSLIGLATNRTLDPASPDYQWVDQGQILQSVQTDNWNAIDPNISFDADNTPWLSFGSFWDGVKMRRLDAASGKLNQNDTKLYALASRGGGPIEAPAIVRHADFYYLFVSFDLCCRGVQSSYRIMVGRSATINGPYLDRSGKALLSGGGEQLLASQGRAIGPGGQSVYIDQGTYRLVYHYYDADANGAPRLAIQDLSWTADGWPAVMQS